MVFSQKIKYNFTKFVLKLKLITAKNNEKGKIKKLRARYRNVTKQKILNRSMAKMKWGVSYSVFDGEELLEPSIRSIRDNVDYINVVYQTKSWTGERENNQLFEFLVKIKEKGLIDELIEFTPNFKKSPGENELRKRNIGLKYAKKNSCNYFMTMDTDEFYESAPFKQAKRDIVKNHISHSYCPIIEYRLTPTERCIDYSPLSVPFFSKIRIGKKLKKNTHNIALADPTRVFQHYFFAKYAFLCYLSMHHMTCIRKDLKLKIDSSSSPDIKKITNEAITKANKKYVIVEDVFSILNYVSIDAIDQSI